MSDTIWVAIITACASTIPQIVLAIIRNKEELKNKQLEINETAKRDALINFITSVTSCSQNIGNLTDYQISEYYKNLNILITYFPNVDKKKFENLSQMICGSNSTINNKLNSLVTELSKSLFEI